jgi:CubicO group peptidase (beta-lactamase class C family)
MPAGNDSSSHPVSSEGLGPATAELDVRGYCHPDFASVEDAFRSNFERGDIGAACAVYVDHELVVNLCAGESRSGVEWDANTLAISWSTSKGILATLIAVLAERGLLAPHEPVATYWPGFEAHGKDDITLAHVLTHTSGLPYWEGYDEIVSIGDPGGWHRLDEIATALADAQPLWPSGRKMAYHALTIGWILGEVVRRLSGKSVDDMVQELLCQPLGLDMAFGVPPDKQRRLADLKVTAGDGAAAISGWVRETFAPSTFSGKALCVADLSDFPKLEEMANSSEFRSAQVPGGNLATTAESLAKLYSMLSAADSWPGEFVVSPQTVDHHRGLWATGHDLVARSYRRRALGFARPCPNEVYGPHDEAFGHAGMGGSLGFADPISHVGFGYVMNHMLVTERLDERAQALIYALYHSLWNRR